jgi:predicted GNAT family N-acyltransferase
MEETLKQIDDIWPETPIFLSAQAHLQGYYARYGFLVTGEEYLEDDIPHIGMRARLMAPSRAGLLAIASAQLTAKPQG